MQKISAETSKMEVALWITEEELGRLVACGQFTTCFNILENLFRRKDNPGIEPLKKKALEDWANFRKNPCYMV